MSARRTIFKIDSDSDDDVPTILKAASSSSSSAPKSAGGGPSVPQKSSEYFPPSFQRELEKKTYHSGLSSSTIASASLASKAAAAAAADDSDDDAINPFNKARQEYIKKNAAIKASMSLTSAITVTGSGSSSNNNKGTTSKVKETSSMFRKSAPVASSSSSSSSISKQKPAAESPSASPRLSYRELELQAQQEARSGNTINAIRERLFGSQNQNQSQSQRESSSSSSRTLKDTNVNSMDAQDEDEDEWFDNAPTYVRVRESDDNTHSQDEEERIVSRYPSAQGKSRKRKEKSGDDKDKDKVPKKTKKKAKANVDVDVNTAYNDDEDQIDIDSEHPSFPSKYDVPEGTIPLPIELTHIVDLNFPNIDLPFINRACASRLAPHQEIGVKWIWEKFSNKQGAILGDDMGMGKTIQLIAFFLALYSKKGTNEDKVINRKRCAYSHADEDIAAGGGGGDINIISPCLIVVPSTIVVNWKNHLKEWGHFLYDNLNSKSVEKIMSDLHHKHLEIVICTYHGMESYKNRLNKIKWSTIIYDEGHRLKNYGTKGYKAALQINLCRNIFVLTGTSNVNVNVNMSFSSFICVQCSIP
jgi:SNF2 family DNA or RNA helicase